MRFLVGSGKTHFFGKTCFFLRSYAILTINASHWTLFLYFFLCIYSKPPGLHASSILWTCMRFLVGSERNRFFRKNGLFEMSHCFWLWCFPLNDAMLPVYAYLFNGLMVTYSQHLVDLYEIFCRFWKDSFFRKNCRFEMISQFGYKSFRLNGDPLLLLVYLF